MESLMLQNSAGVACRSWSPPLPTDTAQTRPCFLEWPSLEHVLPPSASSLTVCTRE